MAYLLLYSLFRKRTTSEERTKRSSPYCHVFGGCTVSHKYLHHININQIHILHRATIVKCTSDGSLAINSWHTLAASYKRVKIVHYNKTSHRSFTIKKLSEFVEPWLIGKGFLPSTNIDKQCCYNVILLCPICIQQINAWFAARVGVCVCVCFW